jgi:hypothetical protein
MILRFALRNITNRAGLGSGAGGIKPMMAQSRNLTIYVAVATDITDPSGETSLGTGRSFHNALIAVASGFANSIATVGTGDGFRTGRVDPFVATCGYNAVCIGMRAAVTGMRGETISCTARSGYYRYIIVPQRLTTGLTTCGASLGSGTGGIDPFVSGSANVAISIAIATTLTGVSGVTVLQTFRCGYNGSVVVTKNVTLGSITDRAGFGGGTSSIDPLVAISFAFGSTAGSTSRGFSTGRIQPIMAQGGLFSIIVAVATGTAVNGVALGGTGGSHYVTCYIIVGVDVSDYQEVGVIIEGEGIGTAGGD